MAVNDPIFNCVQVPVLVILNYLFGNYARISDQLLARKREYCEVAPDLSAKIDVNVKKPGEVLEDFC